MAFTITTITIDTFFDGFGGLYLRLTQLNESAAF